MRSYLVLAALFIVSAANADEAGSLIGRWDLSQMDAYYIRFNANGTLRMGMPRGFQQGTYSILEGGVLELNIVDKGKNTIIERKYRLRGDTLQIKVGANWWTYKRLKAESQ